MAIEKKKIHVKKGDNVVVITGKDAGKKGKGYQRGYQVRPGLCG